jgi:hypothetical protein
MNAMLYLPLKHSASPGHPTVPNEPETIHTPAATVAPAHVENVASSPASVPTRGDQPRSLFAAEQSYEAGDVIGLAMPFYSGVPSRFLPKRQVYNDYPRQYQQRNDEASYLLK